MKRYLRRFTAITVYFGLLSGVCQAFSQEGEFNKFAFETCNWDIS